MGTVKKATKSKFVSEELNDFINESQFIQTSPKKKTQKRQRLENAEEEEDFTKLIGQYQANLKKKKLDTNTNQGGDSRQKVVDVMNKQLTSRKQSSDRMLKTLSDVLVQLEADHNALKDNEQKLEHLTGALIKCIQQASNAHKQKLKALKEIHAAYKKEVEGLLTKGAMKPDDRPLWFDIYKAFPPLVEPKFARPPVEVKPIRPILYEEDVLRAKFHSKGHGLGAVNMLNSVGDSHSKKLINVYKKLQSQGVSEDELIEKSVASVDSERRTEPQARASEPKRAESISTQILSEVNLKDIFNEKKE